MSGSLIELLECAKRAREFAYAPYSGYCVGAAIEGESGRIWGGCNIENVSYGATLCAERVALGTMVAAGERKIRRVAVVTRDGGAPCGLCLQVLFEFSSIADEVEVISCDESGGLTTYKLAELMPHRFNSGAVPRTI